MRQSIEKLLNSDLSSLHIAKQTDVDTSIISRLRNGERKIEKLSLGTAERLYEYSLIFEHKNIEKIDGLRLELLEINDGLNEYSFPKDEEESIISRKKEIEFELKDLLEEK